MKKVFSLLVMSLLCVATVSAQEEELNILGRQKNNTIFIGVKAGATFTSMTQPDECDLYDGSGFGLSGGIAAKVRFGVKNAAEKGLAPGTGYFGLGLEVKYVQNKVKTIGDDDLSMGYFEIPVFAQVYPFAKNKTMNSFFVEAGAAVAGTLSKSPDLLTVNNSTSYVSYATGDLKGFDVRPMVGIGYSIPYGSDRTENGDYKVRNHIDLNARYYVGMSELAGNFPCKMSHLEFSLAWMFSCGKF